MTPHKCEDPECIYLGQPTSPSCKCHRTSDQMMTDRIEALEAALREIAGTSYMQDQALSDIVNAALAPEQVK